MSESSDRAQPRRPAPAWLTAARDLFDRYELAVVALISLAVLLPGLWAFQLIDPWETHYSEVARRMLEDDDWIHLKWQNEIFRSKPVLTFWLIAGSMASLGVADGGGYSGELVTSDLAMFAIRLPFALFGAFGLVMTFWMLRNLASRRIAWLAFAIIATCPFYMLVSRQAITDMPMAATLMGMIACFAMAVHRGSEALPRWKWRINAHHVFCLVLSVLALWQAIYLIVYFRYSPTVSGTIPPFLAQPNFVPALAILLLGGYLGWSLWLRPVTTRGQVYMHWFFLLAGITVLGKGPPGLLLAGGVCFFYLLLTGEWRLLLRLEIPRGLLVAVLVAAPWHLAMWLKDGRAWVNEYFIHHMYKRFFQGVHGERGSFDYFSDQIGVGMWPWAALVPLALIAVLATPRISKRDGRIRLLCGVWAVAGFAMFAASQTKFHHYILPVIPALAILVAFWIDDRLSGKADRSVLLVLLGVAISLLITRDLLGEPKQIIELFIYRYDRPWPHSDPWNVDVSRPIFWYGMVGAAFILALAAPWRRALPVAIGGLMVTAVGFSLWAANGYMQTAAPHWGQRNLHRTYLAERNIYGVEIKYWSLRALANDWKNFSGEYPVESVLPDDFAVGMPQTITILVPGAGIPGDKVELAGQVSRLGSEQYWIRLNEGEYGKLAELIERGNNPKLGLGRRPWVQVDADRLIAWQLNWRGENFWSSGEIYGETEDTKTVFINTNNEEFNKYIRAPERKDRRFFVITEAQRASRLKSVLPTKKAKDTVEIIDTSSNKFTLLRFEL